MTPESTLDNFRASLAGTLLLPAETGYEDCRKIHNAMIDRKPSMIVRCADANDVIAAVDFAPLNDKLVSAAIRPQGGFEVHLPGVPCRERHERDAQEGGGADQGASPVRRMR